MQTRIQVLDHGYVTLRNISGPTRRVAALYDADDTDPANAARISFDGNDKEDRTREEDLKLAGYLLKNAHTSPWEMIEVWMEMKMPIFCARQFIRHRTASLNEMSARYTQLPDDFYIPDPHVVGIQSSSNKQARSVEDITEEELAAAKQYVATLKTHSIVAYEKYEQSLAAGIPRELARCLLPVNVYTKWIWKQNLHNLMHLMKLRLHSHAQYEAQAYAQAIYDLLKQVLPNCMELFDKHRRIQE